MMTLLVALFMVLWAMSSVNVSKTLVVAESVSKALSGPVITGGKAIKETGGESDTEMLQSKPANTSLAEAMKAAQGGTPAERAKAAKEEQAQLQKLKQQVDAYASAKGLAKTISTSITPDGLSIRLETDDPFFDSGAAELKPASRPIMTKVARPASLRQPHVRVVGHTDRSPPAAAPTPPTGSCPPHELRRSCVRSSATTSPPPGWRHPGDRARPVATNATAAGRAENRRVEMLLPRRQEVTGTESTTP